MVSKKDKKHASEESSSRTSTSTTQSLPETYVVNQQRAERLLSSLPPEIRRQIGELFEHEPLETVRMAHNNGYIPRELMLEFELSEFALDEQEENPRETVMKGDLEEIQKQIEATEKLLSETSDLNEKERKELQAQIKTFKEVKTKLEEANSEMGLKDSLVYKFGGGGWYNPLRWLGVKSEDSGLQKSKDTSARLPVLYTAFENINQNLEIAAKKYEEMRVTVQSLCGNFQTLVTSTSYLMQRVDSLESKVNEQSHTMQEQSRIMQEQSRVMQEQSQKIDMLIEMQLKQSKAEERRAAKQERNEQERGMYR